MESSSWILFWNWFLNLVKDDRNKSSDSERDLTDLKQWEIEERNLDGKSREICEEDQRTFVSTMIRN